MNGIKELSPMQLGFTWTLQAKSKKDKSTSTKHKYTWDKK